MYLTSFLNWFVSCESDSKQYCFLFLASCTRGEHLKSSLPRQFIVCTKVLEKKGFLSRSGDLLVTQFGVKGTISRLRPVTTKG